MPPSLMWVERMLDRLEEARIAAAPARPPQELQQRRLAGTWARRATRHARCRTCCRPGAAAASSSLSPIVTLPSGRARSASRAKQRGAVLLDLVRLLAEQAGHLAQHVDEGRPAEARLAREISAAPHRLGRRRQKHGQRPAALLAQQMQRVHVDLVDVRPFLAVDLDVDEQLVHHRRGGVVLEATRAPSRGTSGRRHSRPRAGSACSRAWPSASASGPHCHQSTGLCACCSR